GPWGKVSRSEKSEPSGWVRAELRRNVRQLLAQFGYPPDLSEDATQLVLWQAELATENAE
ncbi:MAG: DUF3387 domain-containing protein, partial [Proteobacteria bacterium]|nr:DUF3387 domain-containing protein [Pseudomonadota bacterium]